MTTPDRKTVLRKTAFAAREVAFAEAERLLPAATRHLLSAVGTARGRVVSGYLPIRTEIDPRPAMTSLHAAGARLCVPVIAGKARPLGFREWTPDADLVEGPFGAAIPREGAWLRPDVLIVPLVAFDAGLNRLGYGGGFYDRTLEGLRAAGSATAIGFAFAAQKLPAIPSEPTDQRLDSVVTECGVMRPAAA